jgi:hypothetical protein
MDLQDMGYEAVDGIGPVAGFCEHKPVVTMQGKECLVKLSDCLPLSNGSVSWCLLASIACPLANTRI